MTLTDQTVAQITDAALFARFDPIAILALCREWQAMRPLVADYVLDRALDAEATSTDKARTEERDGG